MSTLISSTYAQNTLDAILALYATDGFEIALLKSAPTVAGDGTLDIAASELGVGNDGYARIAVAVADFTAASGNNPAAVSNENDLFTAFNEGAAEWETISYVAVLSDDVPLLAIQAASPVTIVVGRRVRIPAGALSLRMASA